MPLRVLLGEGDKRIVESSFSTLSPDQVILAGTRDFDAAERADYTFQKGDMVAVVGPLKERNEFRKENRSAIQVQAQACEPQ